MSESQTTFDREVDELAARAFVRHTAGKPCPLRGGEAVSFVWSNHARPGVYNECHACTADTDPPASVGESIARLEAHRAATASRRHRHMFRVGRARASEACPSCGCLLSDDDGAVCRGCE